MSFAGGIVSALFTVVLAFYIVFAWQQGADIESNASAEADAVVDAYWQADAAPEPSRSALQGLLREYAITVADREWQLLRQGEKEDTVADLIRAIRTEFIALPTDGASGVSREYGLRDVRDIDEAHRSRVDLAAGDNTFNTVLLVATLIGAALVIAFPIVVGMSGRPVNLVVVGVLAFTVGATIYIALQLRTPLDGAFGVEPDAFLDAVAEMRSPT
ncbi:hypothetical protein WEH80_07925 [Actinomycetes bacterium KLBMP 9759]